MTFERLFGSEIPLFGSPFGGSAPRGRKREGRGLRGWKETMAIAMAIVVDSVNVFIVTTAITILLVIPIMNYGRYNHYAGTLYMLDRLMRHDISIVVIP